MKKLPFDLDKALAGQPVVTRSGLKVEELTLMKKDKSSYPLKGIVDGEMNEWKTDGRFSDYEECEEFDLFMGEKTHKYYAYVVHDNDDYGHMKILGLYAHDTELAYLKDNLIKKIEMDIPEDAVEKHQLVRESITKDYDELVNLVKKFARQPFITLPSMEINRVLEVNDLIHQATSLMKKLK